MTAELREELLVVRDLIADARRSLANAEERLNALEALIVEGKCPFNDPLHDHHDGCPSCWQAEQENKGVPDEQDLAVKLNDKGDK